MTTKRTVKGFTLLELMVGTVVTSIIMLAVAAAFIAAQASYQNDNQIKMAVEGGRGSLVFLEHTLSMAGYGLDPTQAFDFGSPPGMPGKDNVAVSAGVTTDDLAFRYREPAYLRRGSLSGTTLVLEGGETFGADLPRNQLMLLGCTTGGLYTAVRLTAAAAATGSTANVTVQGAPFPTNVPPCISSTGLTAPYVMLVNEYRVRVVTIGGRPWLVAFRDLSGDVTDVSGAVPFDPIASDVEDFQVSYRMNQPLPGGCCGATAPVDGTGNADWILGDAAGDGLPNPLATAPNYDDAYDSAPRYSAHPANIRGVRVALGLRSSRIEKRQEAAFAPEALENHAPAAVPDGYYRTTMTTSVRVANLQGRSFFVPTLRSAGDTNDLNYWGG